MLAKFITFKVIHLDQVGFIPEMQEIFILHKSM